MTSNSDRVSPAVANKMRETGLSAEQAKAQIAQDKAKKLQKIASLMEKGIEQKIASRMILQDETQQQAEYYFAQQKDYQQQLKDKMEEEDVDKDVAKLMVAGMSKEEAERKAEEDARAKAGLAPLTPGTPSSRRLTPPRSSYSPVSTKRALPYYDPRIIQMNMADMLVQNIEDSLKKAQDDLTKLKQVLQAIQF